MVAIIATGAAVRLTGSGLGCPDWPSCFRHQLIAPIQQHALIEDANRFVTVALVVLTGVTLLAALLRSPRRKDLVWLAAALVGGVVADAMLGAVVVYSKLNPWVVSLHGMTVSLAMLVVAGVLHHRSTHDYGSGARREVPCTMSVPLARWLWALLALTLFSGMATTGSGPHSGGSMGQVVAKRLPFSLQSAAWLHSVCAIAFIATVAGAYLVLARTGAPRRIVDGAGRLLGVAAAQGLLGVVQYATKLPVVLVELHVLGAAALTFGMLRFQLLQVARDIEPGVERVAIAADEGRLVPATSV